MLAKLANAKWNVHLVAVIVTAIGVLASIFYKDPIVQGWITGHWWANDLVHGLIAALPPVLVYFGIEQKSTS